MENLEILDIAAIRCISRLILGCFSGFWLAAMRSSRVFTLIRSICAAYAAPEEFMIL